MTPIQRAEKLENRIKELVNEELQQKSSWPCPTQNEFNSASLKVLCGVLVGIVVGLEEKISGEWERPRL